MWLSYVRRIQLHPVYRYFLLRFINDLKHKNTSFYNKYFVPLLPTHNYNTRGIKINVPAVRTDCEKMVLFIIVVS